MNNSKPRNIMTKYKYLSYKTVNSKGAVRHYGIFANDTEAKECLLTPLLISQIKADPSAEFYVIKNDKGYMDAYLVGALPTLTATKTELGEL